MTKERQYSEAHGQKWRVGEVEIEVIGKMGETTLEITEAKSLRERKQITKLYNRVHQYTQSAGQRQVSKVREVKG